MASFKWKNYEVFFSARGSWAGALVGPHFGKPVLNSSLGFGCQLQARKILQELKHQKRCQEAVTTIAAYWHGAQVRKWASPVS